MKPQPLAKFLTVRLLWSKLVVMAAAGSVPVIDFADGTAVPESDFIQWLPTDKQKELAKALTEAFSTVGFVCLIETGITQDEIDQLLEQVKLFFALDEGSKARFARSPTAYVGWTAIGRENMNASYKAGDYKETFDYQPSMSEEDVPTAMKCLHVWWAKCSKLAKQIMYLMGVGLGIKNPGEILECHRFGERFNESALRVNFYPRTDGVELEPGQVRHKEHSDYGSITLLCQDSRGLEVMNRSTWTYQQVECVPGGIIVNIGDMMQKWTSDILIANKHQVLIPDNPDLQRYDRVSIPFFAMPDQNTVIKCLVGKNKYEPVVMSDWLEAKVKVAYAGIQQSA